MKKTLLLMQGRAISKTMQMTHELAEKSNTLQRRQKVMHRKLWQWQPSGQSSRMLS